MKGVHIIEPRRNQRSFPLHLFLEPVLGQMGLGHTAPDADVEHHAACCQSTDGGCQFALS
jgi:hypothetical protein